MSTLDGGLLVIKASAGSGKTYTLSRLYIELLLVKRGPHRKLVLRGMPNYHEHILAITFTNKATEEMKSRIVKELYQLAVDVNKSDYRDYFEQMCEPEAFAGLQDAAREALTSMLMNFSTMNVSTIDSFFQSILRNFAHELDRDYNYEVQIDGEAAVKSAVHSFLVSLGIDNDRLDDSRAATTVEGWVRDHIRNLVSHEKESNWNVYSNDSLVRFAKQINQELFRANLPKIREYLTRTDDDGTIHTDLTKIRAFRKQIAEVRDYYKKSYCNDFGSVLPSIMSRYGIKEEDLYGGRALSGFLLADRMKNGDKPTDGLRGITAGNVAGQFKKNAVPDNAALNEICDLADALVAAYDRWMFFDRMVRSIGDLGLLGEIDLKLEQYRKDNNVVLIADTNELINLLVTGKNAVPFVYERVNTWINHFMIDEFQDTSHKQYDNFKPLLDESLSHESKNFNLVIGDAKQAIYRFRNAEPSLFRDKINEDFDLRQSNLPTNFRSLEKVVTFNNLLFELLVDHFAPEDDTSEKADVVRRTYMPTGKKEDYQQLIHKSSDKHPQGYVKVLTSNAKKEQYTKEMVLAELPAYLLDLHLRMNWKQIGILVNTNDEGFEVVRTILDYNKQHVNNPDEQIRVTSDESMRLSNSTSVRRVVNMLRFVEMVQYQVSEDDADDELFETNKHLAKKRLRDQRMYRVLGDFVAAMSLEENATAEETGKILDKCFAEHDQIVGGTIEDKMQTYAHYLAELLPDPRTHLLTLTSIVDRIIERVILPGGAHHNETAFLLAFQNCVAEYANHNSGGTIREFLRYWDQNNSKFTIASAKGEDAVTVMTIHKSKGLEFDCVIIPFANWEVSDTSRGNEFWLPKACWKDDKLNTLVDNVPGVDIPDELLPALLPISKSGAQLLSNRDSVLTHSLEEQSSNALIDNLNKTYVAFTRPRDELHVFAYPPSKKAKKDIELVNELLCLMLPKLSQMVEIDGRGWEMGSPVYSEHHRAEESMLTMPPYYVTPSPGKVQVKLPRDTTAQQSQGNQLHDVMCRIRYQRDAAKAVRRAQQHGIFDGEWTREQFEAALQHLFTDETTARWFADENKVYNERNLETLGKDGVLRPDRVVALPDGSLVVIDYKFGAQQDKYIDQVRGYVGWIARMTEADVTGYLLYMQPGKPPKVVMV